MAKDPAFLFYSSDFLTGVSDLTFEERGQYITLLCIQHQKGFLTQKMIDIAVPGCSEDVLEKFEKTEQGYVNQRLEKEANRRENFIKKQSENGSKGGRPKKPNENPNINPKKTQPKSQTKPIKENEIDNENEDVNASESANSKETAHEIFMQLYHTWYKEKFGLSPKIQAKDAKALKSIITYLKKQGDGDIDVAKKGFEYILEHWDSLDAFHQKQTTLAQIDSNLNNIIAGFKIKTNKYGKVIDKVVNPYG